LLISTLNLNKTHAYHLVEKDRVVKMSFFDKEYILISRRYQLHPASATTHALAALWMHTAKRKKENYKKKVPL
jgi:hypothetical protein